MSVWLDARIRSGYADRSLGRVRRLRLPAVEFDGVGGGLASPFGPVDLGLDPFPHIGRRFDRFDHHIELTEPVLPQSYRLSESRVPRQERLRLVALLGRERA